MTTLLHAWQNRLPLPKETVILLMRAFALQCLESAYRRLDLTGEEIQKLLRGGRLTADRIGHYKQSNYKPVGGITPFFKQFVESSSTWDRVMIGTSPTGGNDWLASLRINTVWSQEGYRIAGLYAGLLRWGDSGIELAEHIVPAAQQAWEEQGWPFAPISRDQSKDYMWGAAWHPGSWAGTEQDLVDAIGARLAALIPVLRLRHQWRTGTALLTLSPRFKYLNKTDEIIDQDPVRGPYEFSFRTAEARLLTNHTYLDATVMGEPVRFLITTGARSLTSCEGAYGTIREVGLALGMRHGDRASFTPDGRGGYVLTRSPAPGLLVTADLAEPGERWGRGGYRWYGVSGAQPLSILNHQALRNGLHRGESVPVYLTKQPDGPVSHEARLADVVSTREPGPAPDGEADQACHVWLKLTDLRPLSLPLSAFVREGDGEPVQSDPHQPLLFVRRQVAQTEPIHLLGAAPDLENYRVEMEQFLEEHGAYMYFWTHGIRPAYRERLEAQGKVVLHLYRHKFATHACTIDRVYTTDDPSGMPSPEPAQTVERDREGTEFDGMVARTWFRVTRLEELPAPIPMESFVDYDSGERIAPQALINAFGYVRIQQEESVTTIEQEEPARSRTLDEILAAFDASPTLVYDRSDLINLHHALHALKHKHFVILHGVSGTGKSRFAQAYANALYGRPLEQPDNPHFCLVPVQPTWQDRTPLLGYFNPLTERYTVPDFLAHVLKAAADPDRPYVLCLDEMNLAVVEHYFADFLSAWESGESITLHDRPDLVDAVEPKLTIPPNLLVIGTVNMDETTHGFSPKVLDRAFTVELTQVDVRAFGQKLRKQADSQAHGATIQRAIDLLACLHDTLAPAGLHFAYRTVDEICRFLVRNSANPPSLAEADALDLMILQKVLPKLRGDDRLIPMLEALQQTMADHLPDGRSRSLQALERMIADARRYGTFQFWR